eukprot:scaffold616_cov89-Phaeocystis_antarctica.AAC.5
MMPNTSQRAAFSPSIPLTRPITLHIPRRPQASGATSVVSATAIFVGCGSVDSSGSHRGRELPCRLGRSASVWSRTAPALQSSPRAGNGTCGQRCDVSARRLAVRWCQKTCELTLHHHSHSFAGGTRCRSGMPFGVDLVDVAQGTRVREMRQDDVLGALHVEFHE